MKFPVPRHHEQDKARFIGTAGCVVTKDPDEGWFNLGAYRCQVYDGKTVGCQITEGKHGRIHRDIYFERGEPMKVVILSDRIRCCFCFCRARCRTSANMTLPAGFATNRLTSCAGHTRDFRSRPTAKSPSKAKPFPANQAGRSVWQWMGYYSDDTQLRPYVNVKTILYRNDPILSCAPNTAWNN